MTALTEGTQDVPDMQARRPGTLHSCERQEGQHCPF